MADRTRNSGGLVSELFQDELRRARNRAGLTQEELATNISYSSALVAAVETGRRMPSADFARRCDEVLLQQGLLSRLQAQVAQEAAPSWMREWSEIEHEAVTLRSWEPLVVPGLMQTPDYAREILALPPSAGKHEQHVAARLERQSLLEQENPPMLFVMIDEGVLRRSIGGPSVMRAQLEKLLYLADSPTISIQVIPASAGAHPGLSGPFVIAGFRSGPDVAYVDTALVGQLVEGREDVDALSLLFDTLRGAALPCTASSELIKDVMTTWS